MQRSGHCSAIYDPQRSFTTVLFYKATLLSDRFDIFWKMGTWRTLFATLAVVLAVRVRQLWHPRINNLYSNLVNVGAGLASDLGVLDHVANCHPERDLAELRRQRVNTNKMMERVLGVAGDLEIYANKMTQELVQVKSSLSPDVAIDVLLGYPVGWEKLSAQEKKKIPVIVYFHGGGWFCGNVTPDGVFFMLSAKIYAVVAQVDYRLSPEHNLPEILQDCFDAFQHLHDNAQTYGYSNKMMSLAGASAGGFLVASVTKWAKAKHVELKSQLLIIPALIPRGGQTEAFFEFKDLSIMGAHEMTWVWNAFIGDYDCTVKESLCYPYKGDLTGYPPTVSK